MVNKYVRCGLYPEGVDVGLHEEFRNLFHEKYGTIHGLYNKELIKAVENVIKVHNGELQIVELMDSNSVSLLTHNKSPRNPHCFRKNSKTDLKRVSINRIPENTYNEIISFIEDNYGTKYGFVSYLVNQAMKLYIKNEKGFIKFDKTFKKVDKSIINDSKGQINLSSFESMVLSIQELQNQFNNFEEVIERKVKSTVQSTLNLVNKPITRMSKSVKNTIKSFRHEDKFNKSLNMLENIMRYREFDFTEKDYHRTLVKLTGQGDMRTVRSDLKMLELDNQIKKIRNASNGIKTYQFNCNNKYYLYNTEMAKNKFLKEFEKTFQDYNALTINELNEFIFTKYRLYDVKSQNKRLKWLIAEGLVKRHEVNPKLLFLQK